MKLSEDIRKEIWQMASDPESVCYIEKHDCEGFKVEEIDGDYCHLCATEKARELDKEDGGKYYHQVYEETSPESDHFSHCAECGCLLKAVLDFHKPHTQIIAVVHNPLLICALSKNPEVNFIEMTRGYVKNIRKMVKELV